MYVINHYVCDISLQDKAAAEKFVLVTYHSMVKQLLIIYFDFPTQIYSCDISLPVKDALR